MKKYFSFLIVAILSVTLISACGDDDIDDNGNGPDTGVVNNKFSIIGTWKKESNSSTTYYTFDNVNRCTKEKLYKDDPANNYTKVYNYTFNQSTNILTLYENQQIKEQEKVIIYNDNQISFDDDIYYRIR